MSDRVPLRLGTKVTLCVAVALVPAFGLATLLPIREIRQDHLRTIEWRSQALSEGLRKRVMSLGGYPPEMQRTLGLSVDCESLLERNSAKYFI